VPRDSPYRWSVPDNGPYRVTHNGLEQYLTDYGCNVTNLSKPGGSNKDMVKSLVATIAVCNPHFVFWFQTDPIRDLSPYDQETFPKSSSELIEIGRDLLENTYAELNNTGVKIHCMGGVANLEKSIEKYSNLIPVIPSITKMFNGPNIDFWLSDWINSPNLRLNDDFLSELEKHPQWCLPKKWFFPDGVHPNRAAHRKIFEFILNQHK
jgi:hypothetical protein